LPGSRITIIGLGKIGGSLGLAFRRAGHTVTGCDRYVNIGGAAVARGAADAIAPDPTSALNGADVVVLATPIASIIELVTKLSPGLQDGTVVLDTGSVKSDIVAAMNSAGPGVRCVGGHPIAGNDRTGFESWDAGLFKERVFALIETSSTDNDARATVERLVADVGARPQWFDANEHDKIAATTSHLPLLIAAALTRQFAGRFQSTDRAGQLVGGQFRSATRMADSPAAMLRDIFQYNDRNVRQALSDLGHDALDLLDDARDGTLEDELRDLAAVRHRIEKR